jgi:hypothetical protein
MNASLERRDIAPGAPRDFRVGAGDRNLLGGTFQLAIGGPGELLTGILEPGDYHFDFSTALVIRAENDGQPMSGVGFGSGNGKFELSLDRLKSGGNPHVPDAGSPLAMLSMALCTLGGIARRVEALTPQAGIGRKQRCLRQTGRQTS